MNLETLDELQSKSLVKAFRIQLVHIQISGGITLSRKIYVRKWHLTDAGNSTVKLKGGALVLPLFCLF